tara:strand:+ start:961 stop:1359 length:399 start_codon:yes stop_codon:yes gene_type:complete
MSDIEEINKHILGLIIAVNEDETSISRNALIDIYNSQQKEIEQLKSNKEYYRKRALENKQEIRKLNKNKISWMHQFYKSEEENTNLKEQLKELNKYNYDLIECLERVYWKLIQGGKIEFVEVIKQLLTKKQD